MTWENSGYGTDHRTRATELQDIAALDRLAAELAPPSALRRYASRQRSRGMDVAGRWTELRRHFRDQHLHPAGR